MLATATQLRGRDLGTDTRPPWGRGVVFRQYYKSIAKCAGKDYRDGAVVPFE